MRTNGAQQDPTQDNEGSEESESNEDSADEESGGAGRLIGKILGWGIAIAIGLGLGLGLGLGALRGDQKAKWFEQQHQLSKMWCAGDAHCLSVVENQWKSCIEDNYESYRKGRFNRKYELDEANYRQCLIAAGAEKLAGR